MPKARSEQSYTAEELFKSGMPLVEIASQLSLPEGTIRRWKHSYKWEPPESERSDKSKANVRKRKKKKQGAQPGNKNGKGGKPGNQNARKHGLFSKYLPADTLEIIENMPVHPLDILWDQIQIAYAAVLRSQQIMHVVDAKDKTEEISASLESGTMYDIQQAWDKQANFLKAQARAQGELRSLIKQYEALLSGNQALIAKEHKARLALIKAQTAKLKIESGGDEPIGDDGFLEALAGTAKEDWSDHEEDS